MLTKIKQALRIDGEDHDEELEDLIASAKREIVEAGASEEKVTDDDELIIRACVLYCKAHFGYDDEKERFTQLFERLLIKLSLLSSYKVETNETQL